MLLYITNKVAAIARELYPNTKFNIIFYHPGGLDASGQDYSHLTTAVSLDNKERKHSTPTTDYNELSYYLDYDKALYKLFRKLVKKLNRHDSLPPKKIDLLIKLDNQE